LGAIGLLAVNVDPRLFAGSSGVAAPDAGLARRWSAPVSGWPSAVAADRRGAVVLAGGGDVRALERDGSVQWQVTVPGIGLSPPALDPARIVVSTRDRVVALDRASGEVEWQVGVPDGDAGPVVYAGDVVLYGTETGALVAVDAAGGEPRWSIRYPGAVRAAPVVTAGLAGVAWHGGSDPRLRVVDVTTGALRWDAPLARFASAPIVAGDQIVVAEGDGERRARVVARSIADGTQTWTATMPASFESGITPGAAAGRVGVVDHFGTLTLLDRRTGAVLEQVELDVPVLHTTVVLTADAVALTTYAGELVIVDAATGRIRSRGGPGGYPAGIARAGSDLLVALRLTDPGRVEAFRLR
jgi:outer membrane protein assembly factor BamB